MRGEALKGHLDLLLLAAVRARPAHGYAIIENLRLRSGGSLDLPEGTVYPVLHRLERAGFLRSRWSEASGRRRRTYEVTEEGLSELRARERDWREFSRAVEGVLVEAT
ncbi:MAG: helix-turn-helix transcriptional regulator [Rubrobacter sp.]|nr:helix-turn-helix transcriptional regulator [Rubrobacter sp.]